jgi:hypothetical protein
MGSIGVGSQQSDFTEIRPFCLGRNPICLGMSLIGRIVLQKSFCTGVQKNRALFAARCANASRINDDNDGQRQQWHRYGVG